MKVLSTSRAVPTSPPWAININKPSYSISKLVSLSIRGVMKKYTGFTIVKNTKLTNIVSFIIVSFRNNALATRKSFSVNTLCSFVAFHVITTRTSKLWNDLPFSRFYVLGNKVTDIWRALRMLKLSNGVHGKNRWSESVLWAGALSCCSQPLTGFIREHRMQLLCSLVSFFWQCGLFRRISSHNRSNTNIIVAYSWVRLTDSRY